MHKHSLFKQKLPVGFQGSDKVHAQDLPKQGFELFKGAGLDRVKCGAHLPCPLDILGIAAGGKHHHIDFF